MLTTIAIMFGLVTYLSLRNYFLKNENMHLRNELHVRNEFDESFHDCPPYPIVYPPKVHGKCTQQEILLDDESIIADGECVETGDIRISNWKLDKLPAKLTLGNKLKSIMIKIGENMSITYHNCLIISVANNLVTIRSDYYTISD